MSDKTIILKQLNKRAKETNSKMLDILDDEFFISALKKVSDVSNKLGYNLVLSEKKSNLFDEINTKITRALMANYISIYYVDTITGEYIGYSGSKNYEMLKIEDKGTNFFEDSQTNIDRVVHEEDRELMHKVMTKDNIITYIQNNKYFLVNYRLIVDGKPTYVSLKALKLSDDDTNMIVGVRNTDEQTKLELEAEKKMQKNITYSNIALALAQNFLSIYYIDVNTNEYIEYNLDSEKQSLNKVSSGKQFFEDSIVNAKKLIYKEDLDKFLSAVNKENLLNALKVRKTFRITYRLMTDGVPTYMSFVALTLFHDSSHIILGISNINEQKKKEMELELEKSKARTDGLTGANNKYSYLETEDVYNNRIKNKENLKFSVVVCDINNLKKVNDTYGHMAGDQLIKDAKNVISSVFEYSTVYRVGGDEFAIILEDKDYNNRDELIKKFNDINKENKANDKVVIAIGISDYNSKTDYILQDIFNRADSLMYENKNKLKK